MNLAQRTLAVLLLAPALQPASDARHQEPWDRRIEAVAVVPTAKGHEARVVWSAVLGQKTGQSLNLSTDVMVQVGTTVAKVPVKLVAKSGSGACSDFNCNGSCGIGYVDGVLQSLLCLPDGAGCGCKFPPIVTSIPIKPKPGDDVIVRLAANGAALPEIDANDDYRILPYSGAPMFWDRRLLDAKFVPSPKKAGYYDLHITEAIDLALPGQSDIGSLASSVEITINGDAMLFELPCGPWLIDRSNPCNFGCSGQHCATIWCNNVPLPMQCYSYKNVYGFGCACSSVPLSYEIPSIKLSAKDDVSVRLIPATGALPELKELSKDKIQL